MNEEWGPARVQYGDWRGTAAMDDPEAWDEIGEFARIDTKEWLILGIELDGGTEGAGMQFASVLAMRSSEWDRLGRADGIQPGQRVEVTRFPFRESDAIGVLQAMKRWSIRVAMRSVEKAQLVVVDEVE